MRNGRLDKGGNLSACKPARGAADLHVYMWTQESHPHSGLRTCSPCELVAAQTATA